MSDLSHDLARQRHAARLVEAEEMRASRGAAAGIRLQRRAERLSHRAERVTRRAERAASRARVAVARVI